MAKKIEVLLAEYAALQQQPGFDQLMQDAWFNSLESEEQIDLWLAYSESKVRHAGVDRHAYVLGHLPSLDDYDRMCK